MWLDLPALLVGDARTALVVGLDLDTGRDLVAVGAAGEVTRVVTLDHSKGPGWSPVHVARLARALPRQRPLAAARRPARLGDEVVLLLRGPEPGEAERLVTRVVGASPDRVTFDAATVVPRGTPLLDADGAVLALVVGPGLARPIPSILASEHLVPRSTSILPLVGLRAGLLLDGPRGPEAALDFDLGVTFDDSVSLVGSVGLSGGPGPTLRVLPAGEVGGSGIVRESLLSLRLGTELRFRVLLDGGAMPLYLDLAAGLRYVMTEATPTGPAMYSGQAGCDPWSEACPLHVGPQPGSRFDHVVGASLGVDLRWGPIALGYRIRPSVLGTSDSTVHELTLGATVF